MVTSLRLEIAARICDDYLIQSDSATGDKRFACGRRIDFPSGRLDSYIPCL